MVMVIVSSEPDTILQRRRNIQFPIQGGKGDIGWPWPVLLARRFLLSCRPLFALALGLGLYGSWCCWGSVIFEVLAEKSVDVFLVCCDVMPYRRAEGERYQA